MCDSLQFCCRLFVGRAVCRADSSSCCCLFVRRAVCRVDSSSCCHLFVSHTVCRADSSSCCHLFVSHTVCRADSSSCCRLLASLSIGYYPGGGKDVLLSLSLWTSHTAGPQAEHSAAWTLLRALVLRMVTVLLFCCCRTTIRVVIVAAVVLLLVVYMSKGSAPKLRTQSRRTQYTGQYRVMFHIASVLDCLGTFCCVC